MSGKDQKIKDEVEKTLNVFDQLEKIEASQFIYTKIKAKIESSSTEKKGLLSVNKRKLIMAAVMIIVIFLNTFSILHYLQSNSQNSNNQAEYLSAFAQQYSLVSTNRDYLENLYKGN